MSLERDLTYRGKARAVAGRGGTIWLGTRHPEGLPIGLYRLDPAGAELEAIPIPGGVVGLLADDAGAWALGGDGRVHRAGLKGRGEPPAWGPCFPAPATAIAALAGGRVGVVAGKEVAVLGRDDGERRQTLELPGDGTCLAVDPTGRWLAVGTGQGDVAVFEAESADEFRPSDARRLHEGAVTALLFEPDDLRFFSAGVDLKLLSTHARGRLEPEDKGRGNMHADVVTALLAGPGDRFFSGSRDGTVKSWPRAGAVKPATLKDGVGRVVGLALVEHGGKPELVAACDDDSLRFFPVDESGRPGELRLRVRGVASWARGELDQDEARRREAALETLAGFGDADSLELIAAQVGSDRDHAVRALAVGKLAGSTHPRAAALLEGLLGHGDEAVRAEAFRGLRRLRGEADLRPLELALKAGQADVGLLAVAGLEALALQDSRALERLARALDDKVSAVRQAALAALERVGRADDPGADLRALASKHADLRRMALVQLLRRGLLGGPGVATALGRRLEDPDAEVRRVAFLLSVLAHPPLSAALRARDPELHRQLLDLEGRDDAPAKAPKAAPGEADREPLLRASASRAVDSGIRGARGLALLGDPRAFGLLLQLSRAAEPAARVEVCRALAALGDPRGDDRLRAMLSDEAAEARDAAFSALAEIRREATLEAADAGLASAFEDVRRRGLQALVAALRARPPRSADDPGRLLLARALDDGAPAVRLEAFKAALNLGIDGGTERTLRFALRAAHADVRLEVLTEAQAHPREPWALDLLLAFFDDPEPTLRLEAFEQAQKRTKGLEFLEAALGSRHADLRLRAVEGLVKKHSAAAQAVLARALDDDDRGVRLAALESLIGDDARPALVGALESPHADVRLRAGRALARHGDRSALAALVALASADEPEGRERAAAWTEEVASALAGLGELGDPSALPVVAARLDANQPAIRAAAAKALIWVARPETAGVLREATRHADPHVRAHAALGLAYQGDASAAPLAFGPEAAKILGDDDRLVAALSLGPAGADRLAAMLDHPDESIRGRALLVLVLRDLESAPGTASGCLACLAARPARVRLAGAEALGVVADPPAFRAFAVRLVNDRGDGPAWKVPESTVLDLAALLARGEPLARARVTVALKRLFADEQAAWDQAWSMLSTRFAAGIDAAREATPAAAGPVDEAPFLDLAFGAYAGLVREAGDSTPPTLRARLSALQRLADLAHRAPRFADAARPVLLQALADPNQTIRLEAFARLEALGMPPAELGAEALAAGAVDVGTEGLKRLGAGAATAEGRAVLEREMLGRADDLATEAARLLLAGGRVAEVAGRALDAAHAPLRSRAVEWLAAEADADPDALEQLRRAVGSRHEKVREAAAEALAARKDPAAFPALAEMFRAAADEKAQLRAIGRLEALGDSRTPGVLLDRIVDDPSGKAAGDAILRAVRQFRDPSTVDRLLPLMGRGLPWTEAAYVAAVTISGHDQDRGTPPDDDEPEPPPAKGEFPRHPEVLARLLGRWIEIGEARRLSALIHFATRSEGRAVDPHLAQLAGHPDDALGRAALAAIAWRARRRGSDPEPLRRALDHRDPTRQFLAAEGLARVGRNDGLGVLLAGVEFLSDLDLRTRAVRALGLLGDARAVDTLFRLATDDGHALQEPALEALGHFGGSARGDEIARLLERHAGGQGGLASHAVRGLRWLDRSEGWDLVRRLAADGPPHRRAVAVEALGHRDDPATRDLLLRLIIEEQEYVVVAAAFRSARRLWGPDSIEPHYAAVRRPVLARFFYDDNEEVTPLDRVCLLGDPARIFGLLTLVERGDREVLAASLLARDDMPAGQARAAVASDDPQTAAVAARVLTRAGDRGASKSVGAALRRWQAAWEAERDVGDPDRKLHDLTHCMQTLAWAAGRLGVDRDALIGLAAARPGDPRWRPVRLEAVAALADSKPEPAVLDALEAAARGDDPEARALAAEALGRLAPARAAGLAGEVLDDRPSFDRLARVAPAEAPAAVAAGQVHRQGVAVPHLVAAEALGPLADAASDPALSDVARLGAIEGLAALASPEAEGRLKALGLDASIDEELRKAAWRGIRRSRRARARASEVSR